VVRKCRGFTLIELLVVIAIIAVLAGLVFIGGKYVMASGKTSSTKVLLSQLQGMLTEMDTKTRLQNQPPAMWAPPTPGVAMAVTAFVPPDFWRTAVVSPSDIGKDSPAPSDRYRSAAILNTGLAMQMLLTLPSNADALQKMPNDQVAVALQPWNNATQYTAGNRVRFDSGDGIDRYWICTRSDTPTGTSPTNATYWSPCESTILDGWDNPIIFVPGGGLYPPAYFGLTPYPEGAIVTDSGKYYRALKSVEGAPLNDINSWEQVPATAGFVRSHDGRPFWASAGPDGDFRSFGDNVYSFEN
jgi:prepilin-type N-terminal cleavage/methylation domain-containing protein